MNYKVEATPQFLKEAKALSKKYSSLKYEIATLAQTLSASPEQGVSLGNNCFKIRLAIKSKGKGKSGGARVITCIVKIHETIFLSSIYDKSEKDSISDAELKKLVKDVDVAGTKKK